MDSGSTLRQSFLYQSWNLENSWLPFRGRKQEPVYSALAGTVITAPPAKTNEHLFVLCSSLCGECALLCSAVLMAILLLPVPSKQCPARNTVLGWVKSRAVLVLLLPVRRKAWSGEKPVQCSAVMASVLQDQIKGLDFSKKIKFCVTWKNNRKLNWKPCGPAIFGGCLLCDFLFFLAVLIHWIY